MTWSPGHHEDGTCSCHPFSVQSVHQTLDEMDFERGMGTLGKDALVSLQRLKIRIPCGSEFHRQDFSFFFFNQNTKQQHSCHLNTLFVVFFEVCVCFTRRKKKIRAWFLTFKPTGTANCLGNEAVGKRSHIYIFRDVFFLFISFSFYY